MADLSKVVFSQPIGEEGRSDAELRLACLREAREQFPGGTDYEDFLHRAYLNMRFVLKGDVPTRCFESANHAEKADA